MGKPNLQSRVGDARDLSDELDALADQLHPGRNRKRVLRRLDEMFRSGEAPDPLPDGFLSGRLVATSTWGPWDSFVQRMVGLWMPWLGKSFEPGPNIGINRFRPTGGTRLWLRIFFPTHAPRDDGPRLEAFPFRNRVGPGEIDPDVRVLKIDYNFEANPALIRRVLDELVQIAPGLYLGKILFRLFGRFYRVGFFALRA